MLDFLNRCFKPVIRVILNNALYLKKTFHIFNRNLFDSLNQKKVFSRCFQFSFPLNNFYDYIQTIRKKIVDFRKVLVLK